MGTAVICPLPLLYVIPAVGIHQGCVLPSCVGVWVVPGVAVRTVHQSAQLLAHLG